MTSRPHWFLGCLARRSLLLPLLMAACGPAPRDTRAGVDARRDTTSEVRPSDARDGQAPLGGDAPVGQDAGAGVDAPVTVADAADAADPCPGEMMCGAECVDTKTDPAHCGGCGMACPDVANGENTCSDGKCAPTCEAGHHFCGADKTVCYADDDVNKCGSACTMCPKPENGSARCEGGMCKVSACNAGFHLCGTTCVPDSSVTQCGTACTACQPAAGLTAACLGNQCRSVCPGAPTVVCSPPAGGTATCTGAGNTCDFTCAAPMCKVGAACVANDTVMGCGASCTKCMARAADVGVACKTGSCVDACNGVACPAAPANGRVICTGNTCDFACNTGFHKCGTACVADTSADQCGPTCAKCDAPAAFEGMPVAGMAACKNNLCTAECNAGNHLCSLPDAAVSKLVLTCIPNAALASCGSSCAPCPGWAETCAADATTGKFMCTGTAGPVPTCEAGTTGCHLCKDECPAGWQTSCVRGPANPDGTAAAKPTLCCNPMKTPICCDPTETDANAADFCDP